MRKVLVTIVLALTAASLALGQDKQIKDKNEYDAYIAAYNMTDPGQKAAAMEAFIKQYPQTIMLSDAMEAALNGYQRAGNIPKVVEMAKRMLGVNPNYVNALAIVTAVDRAAATDGKADALKEGCASAQTGLQQLPSWTKPEGVSDADFAKVRSQMSDIFNGTAGFCALQAKDYAGAVKYYTEAFRLDPTNLQDTYQLSIALLELNPIDLKGLWYGAKALNLAKGNPAAADNISKYVKFKYKKYHGKVDDWDAFATTVAGQTTPPDNLSALITPAPTPCDLAVQAVKDNDPGALSFGDREFVLSQANCSPANKAAADTVWANLQKLQKDGEAKLKISIKVIAATKDSIDGAISDDNQAAMKADVHVVMEEPIPPPVPRSTKSNIPAPGTTTDIIGVISSYTADPFMFTMTKAELPAAPKVKPPVHRPPARKKGR
jgi:tetratricopeptide (TPR) repeat protein